MGGMHMSTANTASSLRMKEASASVRILCDALRRSNRLAKRLKGHERIDEYQNKADILSFLVIIGFARPNGILADGRIGVDVQSHRLFRIHIPPNDLHPAARTIIE